MRAATIHIGILLASVGICINSAAQAEQVEISTNDTVIRIDAADNTLAVTSLKCPKSDAEWIVDAKPKAAMPLLASVEIGGRSVPVQWHYQGSSKRADNTETVLRFVCNDPAIELASIWTAHPGNGPVEHRIEITNRTNDTVLLTLQPTLEFAAVDTHSLEQWWVERGGSRPSDVGTHRDPIAPGFASTLVSTPHSGPIPWLSVQDTKDHRGWYAGIEFSGDVKMTLASDGNTLKAGFGLGLGTADDAAYRTRLAPGETLETPTVFVGCYAGDVDDGANRLRRWVESHLRPASRANLPVLVNNSWGCGMAVDEPTAKRMIDSSADLGLELYQIDAGWYRNVGDWYPSPEKFPNGLTAIADYARSKGLDFGLWIAWTQGGSTPDTSGKHTIFSVHDPEMQSWFAEKFPADWKNWPFTGATVCLGEPKAVDWAINDMRRCVKDYKLQLLEHDQPQIVGYCSRESHRHTTSPIDVAYHAARGYYQVQDALRESFPDLLFEDCCDGGNLVDYGIIRRTHYISITDTYDPIANRRAFYDSSYAVPPAMCECYISQQGVQSVPQFLYMLRSGMMGWCTIMIDTSRWPPEWQAAAKRQFEIFKKDLRPLIQKANLYHVSERPDGNRWDGIEYFDPDTGRGVLYAFRGTTDEGRHTFQLKGLDPEARYSLRCEDSSSPPSVMTGRELLQTGVTVVLADPTTSELVHITRE